MGLFANFKKLSPKKQQSIISGWIMGLGIFLIIFAVLNWIQIVDYGLYISDKHKFQMKYPKNWKFVDTSKEVDRGVLAFVSPKESMADDFLENVNVSYYEMKRPMTIKELGAETQHQINEAFFGLMQFLDSSQIKISGKPAYRLIYRGNTEVEKNTMKYLTVLVIRGNRAYIISYTARTNSFNKYIHTVQSMIRSFRFI